MKNLYKGYFVLIVLSAIITLSIFSCSKDKEKLDSTEETTEKEKSDVEKISDEFKIEYEVSGPVSGKMAIFRKGEKFRSDLNTDLMGQSMNTTTFSDGRYVYMHIDAMGIKKAIKILLEKYEKEMNTEKQDVDLMSFMEHLDEYEKIGTETVLGKECDKYKVNEGVTFSVYDNMYILKIENPGMKMTAVNLDTDASLSDNLFDTPEGVEFTEVETLVKGMGK